MTVPHRLAALRQKMKEYGFAAYVIPTADPHLCEYVPAHYKTREYISGFTGSAGTVAVTADKAGLWTDGRYFLQAKKQLAGSGIELFKMDEKGVPTLNAFLKSVLKPNDKVGIDGKTLSVQNYESMKEELDPITIATDADLIGDIWQDRPEALMSDVFILGEMYTGKSARDKTEQVRSALKEKGADSTIIGALEDVCWLFNIRAHDIAYNPVATAYALVTAKRTVLFIEKKQLNAEAETYLRAQGVSIMPYEAVFAEAAKLTGTVYLDPARTNVFLRDKITEYFAAKKIPINLKYIDPSYQIRSARTTATDSIYCERLGNNAVHAAMAGKTKLVIGLVHNKYVHIPIRLVTSRRNTVDPEGSLWRDVIDATGQPILMLKNKDFFLAQSVTKKKDE